MNQAEDHPHEQRLGTIHVEAEPEASFPQEVLATARARGVTSDLQVARYTWSPPAAFTEQLPAGFTLSLWSARSPEDGARLFYPVTSFAEFIRDAFVGGLALLDKFKNPSAEQRFSYLSMWQLFRRLRRTREHLQNRLLQVTSLRIRRSGRDTAQDYHLLPASVGLNARGEGKRWGAGRLVQEGREEALEQGVRSPTEEDCVHYGLARAAQLNPLEVPDEEKVLALMRLALYEPILVEGSSDGPAHGHRETVLDRSLEAVERHLGDGTAEFDAWFSGPNNSFVRQVAQRKQVPGGRLEQNLVRRVLQDLGWEAYRYVADCLHVMMYVFQRLIPEPLTQAEGVRYEQMYFKQAHFGQLPLVLLVERFGFLKSVLWKLWEAPDDRRAVCVLYRMLAWYAEMAPNRRKSDRKIKAGKAARLARGYAGECELDLELVQDGRQAEADGADSETGRTDAAAGVPAQFQKMARWVRQRKKVRCKCVVPEWEDRVAAMTGKAATLTHHCARCGVTISTKVSLEELRGAV
jgi:hypothetical protein